NDKTKRNDIKMIIGYMPQTFCLFNDLTVKENLGYLSAVYGLNEQVEVQRIIELCNLTSMQNKLAQNLSGGYRQLLSLAGAIIHSPKFLILDEPTSAMDPLFRKNFWKIINECRNNGCTVLVITHYMEELFQCDSFACLSNGKIVFDGRTEQFKHLGELDVEKILETYTKE
ncbi:MAG: ABC transporter ATP-binding protein, partial [Clostridia bacterium]|nr:ABC transporter ATP-binding protein [Clostridia bacterium]